MGRFEDLLGLEKGRFRQEDIARVSSQLTSFFQFMGDMHPRVEGQGDINNYKIIGMGHSGLLVAYKNPTTGERTAWKFAVDVMLDYFAYEYLKEHHQKDLKNVLNCLGVLRTHQVVEFEYIEGKTLEEVMRDFPEGLDVEKVARSGADILNGIFEMHSASIYHRDLHDRNIIIRAEDEGAVIIDLATASRDRDDRMYLNRAYGGNNDLISLGQLMYKMVTGHNLFNVGGQMTCISEAKDEIQRERRDAYDTLENQDVMLEKVREEVPEEVSDTILFLLDDDLLLQPPIEKVEKAKEMFER